MKKKEILIIFVLSVIFTYLYIWWYADTTIWKLAAGFRAYPEILRPFSFFTWWFPLKILAFYFLFFSTIWYALKQLVYKLKASKSTLKEDVNISQSSSPHKEIMALRSDRKKCLIKIILAILLWILAFLIIQKDSNIQELLSFPFTYSFRNLISRQIINKTPSSSVPSPIPKKQFPPPAKQPSKEHYLDVAVNDLDPKYDQKRICLYGNYSEWELFRGFDDLVSVHPSSPSAYLSLRQLQNGTEAIGCGIFHYFDNKANQPTRWGNSLDTDILIPVKNEKPHLLAVKSGNECNKISSLIRKDICVWDFAIQKEDINECNFIQNENIKSTCILYIALNTNQSSYCQAIPGNLKNGPDNEILLYQQNRWLPWYETHPFPDSVPSASLRDICYLGTAINTSDCNEIRRDILDRDVKDACLRKVAFEFENAESCRGIKKDSIRRLCFQDLAVKINNPSVCDELPEEIVKPDKSIVHVQEQSACYYNFVVRTGKTEFCSKIKYVGIEDVCPSLNNE